MGYEEAAVAELHQIYQCSLSFLINWKIIKKKKNVSFGRSSTGGVVSNIYYLPVIFFVKKKKLLFFIIERTNLNIEMAPRRFLQTV